MSQPDIEHISVKDRKQSDNDQQLSNFLTACTQNLHIRGNYCTMYCTGYVILSPLSLTSKPSLSYYVADVTTTVVNPLGAYLVSAYDGAL